MSFRSSRNLLGVAAWLAVIILGVFGLPGVRGVLVVAGLAGLPGTVAVSAFGGGVRRILGEEAPDCLMVAKQRGSVDIAASDFGMRGEDFLRAIERAVPHGHVDEFGSEILGRELAFGHGSTIIAPAPVRGATAGGMILFRALDGRALTPSTVGGLRLMSSLGKESSVCGTDDAVVW